MPGNHCNPPCGPFEFHLSCRRSVRSASNVVKVMHVLGTWKLARAPPKWDWTKGITRHHCSCKRSIEILSFPDSTNLSLVRSMQKNHQTTVFNATPSFRCEPAPRKRALAPPSPLCALWVDDKRVLVSLACTARLSCFLPCQASKSKNCLRMSSVSCPCLCGAWTPNSGP